MQTQNISDLVNYWLVKKFKVNSNLKWNEGDSFIIIRPFLSKPSVKKLDLMSNIGNVSNFFQIDNVGVKNVDLNNLQSSKYEFAFPENLIAINEPVTQQQLEQFPIDTLQLEEPQIEQLPIDTPSKPEQLQIEQPQKNVPELIQQKTNEDLQIQSSVAQSLFFVSLQHILKQKRENAIVLYFDKPFEAYYEEHNVYKMTISPADSDYNIITYDKNYVFIAKFTFKKINYLIEFLQKSFPKIDTTVDMNNSKFGINLKKFNENKIKKPIEIVNPFSEYFLTR
jgi:hypothetical protein